jgi:hypothetical protein
VHMINSKKNKSLLGRMIRSLIYYPYRFNPRDYHNIVGGEAQIRAFLIIGPLSRTMLNASTACTNLKTC